MKSQLKVISGLMALTSVAMAGPTIDSSSAYSLDSPETVSLSQGVGEYEAGRGLITLEGPSGMFINPTSATLPKGVFTAQYCIFFPDRSDRVLGHGFLGAYGVTEYLEVGILGNYIDPRGVDGDGNFGPFARLRLTTNDGWMPQIGVGGYTKFGIERLENFSAFASAYWRIPINEEGFFKSLGVHLGVRENWLDGGNLETFHAYGGLELQMPLRIYAVAEITTKDNDFDTEAPYSFGLQWRAGGINISVAGVQNGGLAKGPAFYFGIGSGWQF
jgi:hypothetical protein